MEERLELKHLSPYLPYNVTVGFTRDTEKGNVLYYEEMKSIGDGWIQTSLDEIYFEEAKLLLRPLSQLTQEIEHQGKKFVPIDELKKLIESHEPFASYDEWTFNNNYDIWCFERGAYDDYERVFVRGIWTPLCITEKLQEWHFDYQGLIPRNLALEIKE